MRNCVWLLGSCEFSELKLSQRTQREIAKDAGVKGWAAGEDDDVWGGAADLQLLEAGGAADGAVVGVATETGLLDQHAVLEAVHTTPVTRSITRLLHTVAGGGRLLLQVTAGGWVLVVVQALNGPGATPTSTCTGTLRPVGVVPVWGARVGVTDESVIRADLGVTLNVECGPEGPPQEHHAHNLPRLCSVPALFRTRGPGPREPGSSAGVGSRTGPSLRRSGLQVTLPLHRVDSRRTPDAPSLYSVLTPAHTLFRPVGVEPSVMDAGVGVAELLLGGLLLYVTLVVRHPTALRPTRHHPGLQSRPTLHRTLCPGSDFPS